MKEIINGISIALNVVVILFLTALAINSIYG